MGNTTLTTLRMRLKISVASMLSLALLALPLGAGAAGLGKVTVLSALGQSLRAEIDITASREELSSLSARVASPNTFKQAGIEYSQALAGVRIAVEKRPDGQPFLSMVSDRPMNEPFLDLLVEMEWTAGRLVREYTFLLDPPEMQQKQAAATATPVAVPQARREAPVSAAAPVPAPTVVAAQPAMPVAGPAGAPSSAPSGEQQKTPGPEMKVIRGPDGVQRIVKAEPAQEKPAKEATTRLVKYGDTLNQIASQTKPEGVSLDQMLVALFLGNQEAFEGNVNRLKAGKIITIPDRETVSVVKADEARTTVRAHAADFNAYRKKLAAAVEGAAAPKTEEPKRAASGKIQPKVEDKAPAPAPGKDKLEVSRSEAAQDVAGKAGPGRIAAIEETLIAREKALKEANSRIAELEKNLSDLRKLVELKSQGMADLQKQAQTPQPAAAVAEAKKAAPPLLPEKPAAKASEAPVQPAAQPPATVTAPIPAAPAPAPAPPAQTDKKPLPPPPPPDQAEPGFIDQSPEIVYGVAAILALLLGWFGYSRRRKLRQGGDQGTSAAAPVSEPSDRSAFALSGGQSVDTDNLLSPTDFSSQSSMGESGSNAGVDPIAEADVYMAYGRDVQAEEILIDALKSDPTRSAIHLKLLEIYVARKSIKQAEAIAMDLHTQTGGVGSDWEKAAQLGRQIDPDNPLYGAGMEAATEFDTESSMMLPTPAGQEAGTAMEGLENLEEEAVGAGEAQHPVEIPPVQEDFTESLDFELDLTAEAQQPRPGDTEPVPVTPSAQPQDEQSGSFDIDLDLDAAMLAAPATVEPGAVKPPPLEEPSGPLEIDLDLDLGMGAAEPAVTDRATADLAMKQLGELPEKADEMDFDFDLGAGKATESPVSPQVDAGNVIDFDLTLPEPAPAQPATVSADASSSDLDIGERAAPGDAPSFDLSSISLELDATPAPSAAPDLDEAAIQEVATKFELALAYEEMGDREGARELLQEVINEGNDEQQAAAHSKLAQLDR